MTVKVTIGTTVTVALIALVMIVQKARSADLAVDEAKKEGVESKTAKSAKAGDKKKH